ncbi:MAG: WD40 repeat domain-containing protein [Deltaproteobacteria bacterium]|nr:WD40 repeat domain-containing protein [Myxococcales bacterium]MDP3217449.1 WD40 repeat domain-containing protein [Deltaproteobacteria bacterium]
MSPAAPFAAPPFLAATLGDRRLRLGAYPNALVPSPDGALLAGDVGGWIALLDAGSREVVRWIPTPAPAAERLAFTADGARLVAGGWRDHALVLDLATGAVAARVPLERPQVIALAASPADPHLVFTGGFEKHARLWDLRGPTLAWDVPCWEGAHALPGSDYIHLAEFSPDGRTLLTVSYNGADLWDLAARRHLHRLAGAEFCVAGAAFSADGRWVFLSSNTNRLARHDAATGGRAGEGKLSARDFSLHALDATADGAHLLGRGDDGNVHVVRTRELTAAATFETPNRGGVAASSRDGRSATVAGSDGRITVVSLPDCAVLTCAPDGLCGTVQGLAWTADDRALVAHTDRFDTFMVPLDGPVERAHHGSNPGCASIDGATALVFEEAGGAVFSTRPWERRGGPFEQKYAAVALPGGRVALVGEREVVFEPGATVVAVPSLARPGRAWASPDGSRVFVQHGGHKLVVLDAAKGKVVLERAIPRGECAAALDRRRIAVGVTGTRVVLLDVEGTDKGRTLKLLADPEAGAVTSVAASPDGSLVAAGLSTGELVLLDAATGAVGASFRAAVGPVWCAAFSHDGARVATGGAEPVVRVWDVAGALRSGAVGAKAKGATKGKAKKKA